MKTCEEFQLDMLLSQSGELNAHNQDELEAHLEHCSKCADHQSEVAYMLNQRSVAMPYELPKDLEEKVLVLTQEKKQQRMINPLMLSLAASFLLGFGFWLFYPIQTNERLEEGLEPRMPVIVEQVNELNVFEDRNIDREREATFSSAQDYGTKPRRVPDHASAKMLSLRKKISQLKKQNIF